jgi:hypothetical protein
MRPVGPEPVVDVEVRYEPRKMTISKVCGLLWNCSDIMPSTLFGQIAEDLELRLFQFPTGPEAARNWHGGGSAIRRTYAAGARAMHRWISEHQARMIG